MVWVVSNILEGACWGRLVFPDHQKVKDPLEKEKTNKGRCCRKEAEGESSIELRASPPDEQERISRPYPRIRKTPTGFQWILDLLQSISLYLVKCGLSQQKDCFRAVLLGEASSNLFKKLANGSKRLQSASLILVLE